MMIALYIADIKVTAITRSNIDITQMTQKQKEAYAKKRKVDETGKTQVREYQQTLLKRPVILEDGVNIPSETYKMKYIANHFTEIPKGNFDYKVELSNVKFSSRLHYEFKD